MRCSVTMVTQQRRLTMDTNFITAWHVNETCYIWQTILNLNCIYKKNILRPLPAKFEHFYLFDPCRAKNLTVDLFFNKYETVGRRYVKTLTFTIYIVFQRSRDYNKRNCWYGIWQHWSNFWIWPLHKLSCDPRLPVQDVTRRVGPIPT